MFYPIEGGSYVDIPDNAFGFIFRCHLPPVGYGVNVMTGELQKTDMLQWSDNPLEHYYQRIPLPFDYKEKRKKEKARQSVDKKYFDPSLEQFRREDWTRRLCGVWFLQYNPYTKKSEWVYITGQHYIYVNWWVYQGKKMDYREPDKETFYVALYCQEDPFCLGLNELTQRKSGKTGRSGCVAYERTSRLPFHHCGIQSKTDVDAEKMFKKAIVQPWRKLPDFYRPIYDLMGGDDPATELRFFNTSRRGKTAEEEEAEEALESFIDYGTSDEGFYDGPELHTYISDETGKTRKEVSIKERARVTREATEIDGEIKGFHWSTTTVEVDEGEEENVEFQEFTEQSNPLNRGDNGMTTSGYYTFFQPCTKYLYFDRYGFPDEVKANTYIDNRRRQYELAGDMRGLSSFKRKRPKTFKEAFAADGEYSLYNPELLNRQLEEISWTTKHTEFGNLEWEDGYRFHRPKQLANGETEWIPNKLNWVPDPNGIYEKVKEWMPRDANNVYREYRSFMPNNNHLYSCGCDPFKYDKTKSKRRSNCAGFIYQKPDPFFKSFFDDMFVLRYAKRKETTREANEDILKMAWWCGCEVLFERNVNHWKDHFVEWECGGFLMWLDGEVEPGVISTGPSIQTLCDYTNAYINKFIGKVYFKTLMHKATGWLGFKVEDHEKFDEPMAAGVTLISVKGKYYRHPEEKLKNIEDYFRYKSVS